MMCIVVNSPSVARAFEIIVEKILKNGEVVETEFGERTKELRGVLIEIANPKLKRISSKYPLGKKAVDEYIQQLLYGTDNDFAYTYHERLFEWADSHETGWIDQVEYVIDKLKFNENTRRALAVTWIPTIDCKVKDDRHSVPCLQYIQFLVRNGKLEMYVVFRSNDMFLAFHSNALGLIRLGEVIANEIGFELGKYVHYVISAHIYIDRDRDMLEKYFDYKG